MNTPQDPFESRLRQRLQSTPIDLPPASGPHAAADRAAERFRRRRTGLVAAAAIAIVGGVAAPALLGDDGDSGVNTEFAAPVNNDGVELDWQVHDDGLSTVRSSDQGADGFYALSTGPGTRYEDFPDGNAPQTLYRWDGSQWQVIGDADTTPSRISERDGTLYALSTAADTGNPVGSVSTDGGASWTVVPLDSIQPPNDRFDWRLNVQLDVASNADATVAVINHRFDIPTEDVFPELESDTYGVNLTESGMDLVSFGNSEEAQAEIDAAGLRDGDRESPNPGPSTTAVPGSESGAGETVVRSVTWAELGLSGPEDLQSQVTTYRADGNTWTEVDNGPSQGSSSDALVATDSGILFQGTIWSSEGDGADVVLHTTDGTTWQPIALPDDSDWGQTSLAPNGAILHVTSAEPGGESTVSVSTDLGATWAPIDLTDVAEELTDRITVTPYSGPLGTTLVINEFDEDGPVSGVTMLFSNDLQSWTVTDLDDLFPDDAPYVGQVLVGNDKLIVQANGPGDPDDGVPGPTATLVATPVR